MRRGLLVTGGHRSGTGWVAQALASSPTPLGYVWEPFNPNHRQGTFDLELSRYFEYVCAENADESRLPIKRALSDTLNFRYRPLAELRTVRSAKDGARMARDWARYRRYRSANATPLLKDPIALFSAEWLVDTFDLETVVLIRHPAAFASSLKRRNWRHDFRGTAAQPLLLRDLLAPYADEIRRHAEEPQDIIDEAILLWNMIYGTTLLFQERRPDWISVRLEDLARNPVPEFRSLFERIGLTWNDASEAFVTSTSSAINPVVETHGGSVKRNSLAHSWSWRQQLSEAELERIREGTGELANAYYTERDWEGPS